MKEYFNLLINFLDLRGVERVYLFLFTILAVAMGISIVASSQALYIFAYANIDPLKNVMGFDIVNDFTISFIAIIFAIAVEGLQASSVFVFAQRLAKRKNAIENNSDKKDIPKLTGILILTTGALLFNGTTMYYGAYTQEKIKELNVIRANLNIENPDQIKYNEVISDLNVTNKYIAKYRKVLDKKESQLDSNINNLDLQISKLKEQKLKVKLLKLKNEHDKIMVKLNKRLKKAKREAKEYEAFERTKLINHADNYKTLKIKLAKIKHNNDEPILIENKRYNNAIKKAKSTPIETSTIEANRMFKVDIKNELINLKSKVDSLVKKRNMLRLTRDSLIKKLSNSSNSNSNKLLNYKLHNTEYPKKVAGIIMLIGLFFGYFKGIFYSEIVREARLRKERKKNKNVKFTSSAPSAFRKSNDVNSMQNEPVIALSDDEILNKIKKFTEDVGVLPNTSELMGLANFSNRMASSRFINKYKEELNRIDKKVAL